MAVIAAVLALLLALAIPAPEPPVPPAPQGGATFSWDRDTLWQRLGAEFEEARGADCGALTAAGEAQQRHLETLLEELSGTARAPGDPLFGQVEQALFEAGPMAAACRPLAPRYVALALRLRQEVKNQSRQWDLGEVTSRERLYRSLYGSRAALEEVLVQQPGVVPALLPGRNEPSATPAATVGGVVVHSGDMVVSRGGAPTSALIARGNDRPGNFSHVALVHVDAATGTPSVVEAHIERGVAVANAEQYLADTKLRLMLLRPRADLPALRADPLLPHRAAEAMLARARAGHVPYDFAMDYTDPSHLFCSEVVSWGYRDQGITLWTGLSTISGEGLRRWLAGFGVRHFETQEPSDLEYDPQLVVVAEWRDPEWLARDRIDNAVLDAMLEQAEAGRALTYSWYELPAARVVRGWSWLVRRFGGIGPVPEGMTAAAALRSRSFSARQAELAVQVTERSARWEASRGHPPPYWELVALARQAAGDK